jgi:hypothetical protein
MQPGGKGIVAMAVADEGAILPGRRRFRLIQDS